VVAARLPHRRQVLFNPGPVNLHPRIKEELFSIELSHRQPEFDQLAASVSDRLFDVARLPRGDLRLSLLHGSGTLAVDAALTTFVRGKVLVINNGFYCERIATTLARLGQDVVEHRLALGQAPDLEEVAVLAERETPDWIAAVHHETTTGLLNPLSSIADVAEHVGARLFVDAVSAFGVHPLDERASVVCFNSSKCLESLPGIAGVFWRAGLSGQSAVPVLDVTAYADALPSTPNVQAFLALDIALDLLAAEDRAARYRRLACCVWEVGSRHFSPLLPEIDRSHVLTAFRLDGRDPDELFRRALEHGFVIYHGQRQLRDQIFRVANMGVAIDEAVIVNLFEVLAS
jgi:2-aminoethylphosphonate-pyruvate transaminase